MSLRVRLSLAFLAMVSIPLVVAVVVVLRSVSAQLDREAQAPLPTSVLAVDAGLGELEQRSRAVVSELGRSDAVRARLHPDGTVQPIEAQQLRADLTRYLTSSTLLSDFVAVTDDDGIEIASASRTPAFPAAGAPTLAAVLAKTAQLPLQQAGPWTIYAVSDVVDRVTQKVVNRIVAGFWVDPTSMNRDLRQNGVDVTLLSGSTVIASTITNPADLSRIAAAHVDSGGARLGDLFYARSRSAVNGADIAVSVPRRNVTERRGQIARGLLPVVAVSVLLAAVLGWLVARYTTRPLAELGNAALRVSRGELDTTIAVRSKDEVGQLATAFNTMTGELRGYVAALQASRDELSGSLTRLGDTLSSTHDLKRMLAVVLETAMLSSGAEAGALMLFSRTREELYLKVGRGLDGRLPASAVRVKVGTGVAGRVARTGEQLHGRVGTGPGRLELAPTEPTARSVVSVPLRSHDRIIGVLSLYDRSDGTEFAEDDVATIRSFANQASTAIDNVLLHQEAQRLSITDGLTGLWNYRYFQMKLGEELERAGRFGRQITLLILDLDFFKKVNDEHGHQRGDAVLIELATRVKSTIREVDVLARYGGEEFVLLLPETDIEGAERTAARIGEVVRQRRFGGAGEAPVTVTVSVGVAVYPDHADQAGSLIAVADAALYEAKRTGRDRYVVATAIRTPSTGGFVDVTDA